MEEKKKPWYLSDTKAFLIVAEAGFEPKTFGL